MAQSSTAIIQLSQERHALPISYTTGYSSSLKLASSQTSLFSNVTSWARYICPHVDCRIDALCRTDQINQLLWKHLTFARLVRGSHILPKRPTDHTAYVGKSNIFLLPSHCDAAYDRDTTAKSSILIIGCRPTSISFSFSLFPNLIQSQP